MRVAFEQEVLKRLDRMERMLRRILQHLEGRRLTAREHRLLERALKEEKEGKLISRSELKGQLGL